MPSPKPELHTAFFYGTLMAPSVLKRVTSHDPASTTSPLRSRSALLHKHRRHKVKGADYPAVIPNSPQSNKDISVRGTVVQGLTSEDIWRLDVFEGDEYERKRVRVQILPAENLDKIPDPALRSANNIESQHFTNEELEAETYIWIAGEHRLEDQEWDFDEFVREKMWRWAPSEESKIDSANSRVDAQAEDEGFEDVRRAVEERKTNGEHPDHDATGGRLLGGTFEHIVRQGKDREEDAQMLESAVEI